jgi:hypothetical protein
MLHFSSKSLCRDYAPPSRNPAEDADSVRPFGPSGVGLITGHPVGLVVALGIVLLTIIALPPARIFFLGAILFGGIIGFFLWLYNRKRGF